MVNKTQNQKRELTDSDIVEMVKNSWESDCRKKLDEPFINIDYDSATRKTLSKFYTFKINNPLLSISDKMIVDTYRGCDKNHDYENKLRKFGLE